MQKFSLHMHTLGFDGQQTETEMLQQAEALGWSHIGISNHFIVHPNIKKSPMYHYAKKGNYAAIYSESFDEAIAKFIPHYQKIDEINQISKIKILKGMEVDYFDSENWYQGFIKALECLKPDYIIGSAHFVERQNILYNSHDIKAAPQIEQNMLLHRYWQNIRAAASSGLFNFIAHLDLLKKVHLGAGAEWIADEEKTIASIKESKAVIELNTSAFKFCSEPYPGKRIMQMAAQADIPVIISDDAHKSSQLGNWFVQTEEMAKSCGIKTFLTPDSIIKRKLNNEAASKPLINCLCRS